MSIIIGTSIVKWEDNDDSNDIDGILVETASSKCLQTTMERSTVQHFFNGKTQLVRTRG